MPINAPAPNDIYHLFVIVYGSVSRASSAVAEASAMTEARIKSIGDLTGRETGFINDMLGVPRPSAAIVKQKATSSK